MTTDTIPSLLEEEAQSSSPGAPKLNDVREEDAPDQGPASITFPLSEYSDMAPYTKKQLVDAACKVTYDFARKGLEYGKDFRFDDQEQTVFGFDGVTFKFHLESK